MHKLPAPADVKRTAQEFHPVCPSKRTLVRIPSGGLAEALIAHRAPALNVSASKMNADWHPPESFSRSPPFRDNHSHNHFCELLGTSQATAWDRICGLLLDERGLLAKASLDLDGPLSWHPALRVVFMTGDDLRPLSCSVGSRVYRVNTSN